MVKPRTFRRTFTTGKTLATTLVVVVTVTAIAIASEKYRQGYRRMIFPRDVFCAMVRTTIQSRWIRSHNFAPFDVIGLKKILTIISGSCPCVIILILYSLFYFLFPFAFGNNRNGIGEDLDDDCNHCGTSSSKSK
jgi:hypothetical protein